mgnify:CR=1 FL=1
MLCKGVSNYGSDLTALQYVALIEADMKMKISESTTDHMGMHLESLQIVLHSVPERNLLLSMFCMVRLLNGPLRFKYKQPYAGARCSHESSGSPSSGGYQHETTPSLGARNVGLMPHFSHFGGSVEPKPYNSKFQGK